MLQVTGTEMETTDSETGEPKITYPGGVDPLDYVTIASVCMGIYKSKFLTEDYDIQVTTLTSDHVEWKRMQPTENGFNVRHDDAWLSSEAYLSGHSHHRFGRRKFVRSPLAHVPSEGYTKRYNHSKISIAWLEWIMDQNKIHIQHALNGGEFKIQGTNYHSDGYCQKTNTVYEFLGCCFHGCRVCYPNNRAETKHPLTKQSMEELYVVTKKRESAIRDLGYKYRQIWEHEFRRDIDKTDDLKAFIDRLGLVERISPRDAFMGGRCNGTKMYCKTDEGEKIKYVDFTSLYPWTNKYSRYPLGHPKIITSDFEDIHHYFGLCKLKILPPRGLYHPVLPYRCNKKLTFPLCRTCVEEENRNPCICSEEKRAFVGTYATPEVLLAVEKGYKILKIYEIWHFPETTKYDKEMKSGGLFSDYVQLFLKIKQESSGFPKECKTEEQKQEYIRLYKENEGIHLDYDNIKENPGLRSLAKLCLNSFWGKFGQRLILKKHSYFHETESEKFFQVLSDPTKVVENFHIVSKDTIQLEWSQNSLFPPVDVKTNIFIAIFTTMWARLKLYSVLDLVGTDCLYYDTDSCVYLSRDGTKEPILGNYLGELTSEISPEEGHIVEFVCGGPKNYAYRTLTSETCKVKGFTLNFVNSNIVNFDAIKSMIARDRSACKILTNPSKIIRLATHSKIYSREENKKYCITYNKRVLLDNYDTIPYGY
ncbi:Hypothetical predicted protein [Mytilus galloprovincialis]|uniref:DNA-directed DNA polymerase n=2 Tax=Mytilus TaxID=6548 RepID=A0A8B6FDI0_MYTGA|nr:Hypothetical predicted protein [Mytilus galloprovincialis]